jgi:hypothetical protein
VRNAIVVLKPTKMQNKKIGILLYKKLRETAKQHLNWGQENLAFSKEVDE